MESCVECSTQKPVGTPKQVMWTCSTAVLCVCVCVVIPFLFYRMKTQTHWLAIQVERVGQGPVMITDSHLYL